MTPVYKAEGLAIQEMLNQSREDLVREGSETTIALASFNPISPVARAATSVGDRSDLHTSGGFPRDNEVGKPLEHHPACAKCIFGEVPGVICESFDRAVKPIQEHFRSPHSAPPVPFGGGFGFFQSGGVNSNG